MEDKKEETLQSGDETLNLFCFQINKVMLRFKAHFFLCIGAMAIYVYIPIVAKNRLGMSASPVAAVFTAQQLITIFSKPIIGYVADYLNKLKLMLSALIVIQTMCFFLLLLIPSIRELSEEETANNFEVLKDNDGRSDYVVVAVKPLYYCNYSSDVFVSSALPSDAESLYKEDVDNSICILQRNKSHLSCFEENVKKQSFAKKSRNNCCYIVDSHISLNNMTLQEERRKYFRLMQVDHDLNLGSVNQSFICTREDMSFKSFNNLTVNEFETFQYWLFALLLIVTGMCDTSIFTLGDTACLESIEKHGGDFGRQRLYGAVGWGTIAPIAGFLCDLTNDYLAAWILMAVLQLLALWNISRLDLKKPHFSQNVMKDISTVLKSGEFLVFDLAVFMNGMGAGVMWFYLVWFLTALGGSKFLCGLVHYVQCFAGEIPFMFFSTWIIKKLGHMNLMTASLVCYAIRFLWYSYLQDPWLVLLTEILHGITYGTFYPTVASFGKVNAKPGTEATMQSILFSTHEGLGAGVGCILAGIGFDYFGGHRTFFYIGIFFISGTVLNILNTFLTRKRFRVLNVMPAPTT